jgi:hypothetical protein
MRHRIHPPLVLAGAAGVMALGLIAPGAAFAAGNGVANKSANQIASATSKAMNAATSYTYVGTVKENGTSATLNLSLSAAGDGQGSIDFAGQPVKLIKIGDTLYVSSNTAFWTTYVSADFATQVGAGWGSVSATDPDFEAFATLFDSGAIVSGFLSPTANSFTKGKTSTVNGKPVIALGSKGKKNKSNGTIYVATTGQPYILKVSSSGSDGGSLAFLNYNKAVTATAPANPIAVPSSSSTSTTG